MGKNCRHVHHDVEPQKHVWNGGQYKRTEPGQVFCRDCKVWLYEKPINWDLVPKNAAARAREMAVDDAATG